MILRLRKPDGNRRHPNGDSGMTSIAKNGVAFEAGARYGEAFRKPARPFWMAGCQKQNPNVQERGNEAAVAWKECLVVAGSRRSALAYGRAGESAGTGRRGGFSRTDQAAAVRRHFER